MSYIIAANILLWSTLFAYVMPSSVDKELSNKDNIVAVHNIELDNQGE